MGAVPTPVLALAARNAAAIMITGSHIPADRNGLKFYTRSGEITKADEAKIQDGLGATCFTGKRIGFYAHASVGMGRLTGRLWVMKRMAGCFWGV